MDIMLVIDVSRSMLAEDFTIGNQRANRLEAVKKVTEQFIRQRPNDRIGIVAFGGRPYLVSLLTLDHDWLIKNLDRVQIGLGRGWHSHWLGRWRRPANRLKDKTTKTKLDRPPHRWRQQCGPRDPDDCRRGGQGAGHSCSIRLARARTDGTPVPFPFQDPFGRAVYQQRRP